MNKKILISIIIFIILGGIYYHLQSGDKIGNIRLKDIVQGEDLVSVDEAKIITENYLDVVAPDEKIVLNETIDTWYSLDGLPTAYIFYGKTKDNENAYLAISAIKTIRPFYCGGLGSSPQARYDQILKTQSYKERRYLFFGNPMCVPFLELRNDQEVEIYYLFGSRGVPNVSTISKKHILSVQKKFYDFIQKSNNDDFGKESRDIWNKNN